TSDRSMADIARELGVHHKTLGNWVSDERRRRARATDPTAVNEAERDELRRLRKEIAELRMEREILRKAAAYFAKGPTRSAASGPSPSTATPTASSGSAGSSRCPAPGSMPGTGARRAAGRSVTPCWRS